MDVIVMPTAAKAELLTARIIADPGLLPGGRKGDGQRRTGT